MDLNGCPHDYDDLTRHYFQMIRGIVARQKGIDPQDVDDRVQEIMVRVVDRDLISMYDPKKAFMTPDGLKKSRFAPLLRSFVKKYLRGIHETATAKAMRDAPSTRLEQPTSTGDTWVEVYAPIEPDTALEAVETRMEFGRVYEHLDTIHVHEDGVPFDFTQTLTLGRVLRAAMTDLELHGRFVRRRVAEELGVSDQSVTIWMRRIREELEHLGFPGGEYLGEAV